MDDSALHLLLIEDNAGDARLLRELLSEVPSVQFEMEHSNLLSQGLQRLQQRHFDIILLDLFLPDSRNLKTFVEIYQHAEQTPIIVITGLDDETLAVKAVQMGAQDYLVKGTLSGELLARSIRYAIERKRTEQKIHEQAALLDVTSDAILVQDLDRQILYWNQGAERLYGWKAEEVLGKSTSHLSTEQSLLQLEGAESALEQVGEWQGELQQLTKADQVITVESRWTLIRNADQTPKSILIVNTDITEKKKLESQFFRTQRLESLGTLASGIAHDLNNILTPILAAAQLLQMKASDPHSQELLQLLEGNAKRGAALVKQVLSFARGVGGKRTTLHIKHLIREIQQIVLETFPKSIEVRTDIAQDVWTVSGDATQLHQVLMNLCVNARDAMPDGGLLKIAVENFLIDENYTRMNLDARVGAYIVITVSDEGSGIAPDILDRIFEPFFTTKDLGKGTGLGLSTVLGIVKSHHGFIDVTSQLSKGTQFRIFLPAIVATELHEPENLAVGNGNNELILVVDDEAAIREVNQATLESYHYRVLTANDGIEAISLYAQHKHEISLVLLDMMMPAMDGATTIRTLQRINPQVKIVAMSGLASSTALENATQVGIQGFLAKPYTARELIKAIEGALRAESAGCRS